MAKLNITQAAQAVGKHRSTLQRHIKDGTLSKEEDGTGNPVIDVAELQRVYGSFDIATDATPPQMRHVRQSDAPQNDSEIRVLEVKLEALERERDAALREVREERDRHSETKTEKARLFDMLEQAQKTIAALPPANAKPDTSEQPPAKRGLWKRMFG